MLQDWFYGLSLLRNDVTIVAVSSPLPILRAAQKSEKFSKLMFNYFQFILYHFQAPSPGQIVTHSHRPSCLRQYQTGLSLLKPTLPILPPFFALVLFQNCVISTPNVFYHIRSAFFEVGSWNLDMFQFLSLYWRISTLSFDMSLFSNLYGNYWPCLCSSAAISTTKVC